MNYRDYKTIDEAELSCLQPRQLELLYWFAKGEGHNKMGLSNKSASTRQNAIRIKLGLSKHLNLRLLAERNKDWILKNAKVKGNNQEYWAVRDKNYKTKHNF